MDPNYKNKGSKYMRKGVRWFVATTSHDGCLSQTASRFKWIRTKRNWLNAHLRALHTIRCKHKWNLQSKLFAKIVALIARQNSPHQVEYPKR